MSLISTGGTRRATRPANKARHLKPGDNPNDPNAVPVKGKHGKGKHGKPKTPPKPKQRPLGPADIIAAGHPLRGPLVAWLLAKGQKLGQDLPLTKRQARKFLAAYPQYRAIMVPVEDKKAA